METTDRLVIGIDQSAAQPGLCRALITKSGEVKYTAGFRKMRATGATRLVEFADWFLSESAGASLVVMEQRISYGSDNKRAGGTMTVHEIAGVLKYLCRTQGLPLVSVWPSHLKQWATGRGKAGKPDMVAAAEIELGVKIAKSHHDVADAYFLAQIGVHRLLSLSPESVKKQAVLASVLEE